MQADLVGKYIFLSYFILLFLKKITNINSFSEKLIQLNYSDGYKISLLLTVYLGFSLILILLSDAQNRYPKYMKIKNKMGRLGIIMLIIYVIVSTYNFHNVFASIGNLDVFFMNISLVGGLIILYKYYSIYIHSNNKQTFY
tara:strand:+ start:206 stop:628 length:423 start_codon:yes stop_codon:yes gene_type:complete